VKKSFLTSFCIQRRVALLDRQLLERYRRVLQQYRLHADYIEDYGKVKKIYTKTGTFALKEIANSKELQSIHTAYQIFNEKAIPLYRAHNGTPFVLYGERYYYLMPWFSNETGEERNERYFRFFRDLAQMHRKSLKEFEVKEEEAARYYEMIKKQWEAKREFLQSYVETCEDEWYMSPFQLQFCTYFHETMQAYWFAQTQLEKWYEKIKETKKWRIAVVHGNASLSHYLYDEKGNGYFLSFERARMDAPLSDVLQFFQKYLRTYPVMCDECVNWFFEYERIFTVRDEEMALFLSHLAQPEMIYQIVWQYVNKSREMSEQQQISRLQKAYWTMKNLEYVIMRMIEIDEKKKAQEESHASS
jgi:spore coat protein YsxE